MQRSKSSSWVFLLALGVAAPALAGDPSLKNGDVNGDGTINLTDPVYLLTNLFLGGDPPVPITCPPCPECPKCPDPCPPPPKSQFRILNDVTCNNLEITADLDLCGTKSSKVTGFTSSDCQELPITGPVCRSTVSLNTVCGAVQFCADIPVQDGHVYDVVVFFNPAIAFPGVLWFDRSLDAGGACPAFPTPGDPAAGEFVDCTNGGGFEVGEVWGSAEAAWQER